MWRKRDKQMKPGGIEVYANHEQKLVFVQVAPVEKGGKSCVFGVAPEDARELAQRMTLASWMVEEGPDANM